LEYGRGKPRQYQCQYLSVPQQFDPQKPFDNAQGRHHRRSIRLKGYDYSQAGEYFVTIVSFQRELLFGEIIDGKMNLNEFGKIADACWPAIPEHFPNVDLGVHVVMPNHIHGIIVITDRRGEVISPHHRQNLHNIQTAREKGKLIKQDERAQPGGVPPPLRAPTLGQIVAYFKYQFTKNMNALDGSGAITKFWQRNYYEHIIRNDREMKKIWNYIESNPSKWANDNENPLKSP
jgi:putative transposase